MVETGIPPVSSDPLVNLLEARGMFEEPALPATPADPPVAPTDSRPYNPADATDRRALAAAIVDALTRLGATDRPGNPAERQLAKRLGPAQIVCWTSIHGDAVAAKDADAIRFAVLVRQADGTIRPITERQPRVYRTGTIEDIVGRVVAAWQRLLKEHEDAPKCHKCGAPLALSKGQKRYCSAICWKR